MRLLYGTGNAAKLEAMRRRLAKLDLEILGLEDMDKEAPYVTEDFSVSLADTVDRILERIGYCK